MNEKDLYEYYAFISCAPDDETFAKWLQKNMESFRLPARVQNSRQAISDKIGQFFLDKKAPNTGKMTGMVQTELFVSKYLLVICTPSAAQSQNVNEEVRVFLTNGRKDHIVLLMVGGEPDASDPQKECLPAEIRELPKDERPILWDFRTANRDESISSLIASLMQVPETALLRYNKKSKALWRTLLYSLVAISILIGVFLWEYNRVRYEYYVSFVDRWGIPEGIEPLTSEQVSACSFFYRFEYRHTPIAEGNPYEWRLVSVSCMNGYGQLNAPVPMDYLPKEKDFSVCKLDYLHGNIYSLSFYNNKNQLFSTWKLLDFKGQPLGWIDRCLHRGSSGSMMENGSVSISGYVQIPCIKIDRDGDGYIQRISYHANNDRDVSRSAICDEFQVFGYDFFYDKKHRLVKIVSLSKEMKPQENKLGIMSVKYVYDETTSRVTDIVYQDKSGKFIEGLPQLSNRYDENGNVIETSYYDEGGAPCLVYESGVFMEKNTRDEYGAIKECRYFDESFNLMNSKQGYARACYARDAHGNALTTSFYNEMGNLILMADGYAQVKMKYNENNKIVEMSYFGVDEKPILNHEGYACIRFTYNDLNRTASESYFDETGMPIKIDKFGARVEYGYNEVGLLASESYYDEYGQPYIGQHGMSVVYKYDDRGNRIEKTFYDDKGNLYAGVDRVARFRYWYNGIGLQTEARCYGTDDKLVMNRRNFSILRSDFDSLSRIANHSFFDKEDRPASCSYLHCSQIKQFYEPNQNNIVISIKYNWDGNDYVEISRTRVQKDIHGNVISCRYFDSHGQISTNEEGLSSWTAKYDQRGNRIECNYFGIDGNPLNARDYNFASWKASYDYNDRRIEQSYYDIHGNLTANNRGVARWKAVYENGNTPYMYYYDLAGNIISNDEK